MTLCRKKKEKKLERQNCNKLTKQVFFSLSSFMSGIRPSDARLPSSVAKIYQGGGPLISLSLYLNDDNKFITWACEYECSEEISKSFLK